MRTISQFSADLLNFTKKSLTENYFLVQGRSMTIARKSLKLVSFRKDFWVHHHWKFAKVLFCVLYVFMDLGNQFSQKLLPQ